MALVKSTITSIIMSACQSLARMAQGSADGLDVYLANQFKTALSNYLLTISITTADTGVATGGVYTGIGKNTTQSLNPSFITALLSILKDDKMNESRLANRLASAIDDAFSFGTWNFSSTGTVTPPIGSPIPMTCTGTGKWTGVKSIIEGQLIIAFQNMNASAKRKGWNGNKDFADAIANAVDLYCKSGVIAVTYSGTVVGTGTSTSIS